MGIGIGIGIGIGRAGVVVVEVGGMRLAASGLRPFLLVRGLRGLRGLRRWRRAGVEHKRCAGSGSDGDGGGDGDGDGGGVGGGDGGISAASVSCRLRCCSGLMANRSALPSPIRARPLALDQTSSESCDVRDTHAGVFAECLKSCGHG